MHEPVLALQQSNRYRRWVSQPTLIKKYGNRRLYDTSESHYITLDELATKIQSGVDVKVVDVNSGDDLTQVTLTQIIIEGRGAAHMLPVPLLTQLIRLGDDALAEFLGHYMSMTLDFYLRSKHNAAAMTSFNPFANLPFSAMDSFSRMVNNAPFMRGPRVESTPPAWQSSPSSARASASAPPTAEDMASLRNELEELKQAIRAGQAPPATDAPKKSPRPRRTRKRKE